MVFLKIKTLIIICLLSGLVLSLLNIFRQQHSRNVMNQLCQLYIENNSVSISNKSYHSDNLFCLLHPEKSDVDSIIGIHVRTIIR